VTSANPATSVGSVAGSDSATPHIATAAMSAHNLSALAKMYLEPLCGRRRMIMAMQPKGQQKSAGSLHQKWLADRRGVED